MSQTSTLTREQRFNALAGPAYAAYDGARLDEAVTCFRRLLRDFPHYGPGHYMLGLARKYLGHWKKSLRHNLRALELYRAEAEEAGETRGPDEGAAWNAGIAATALGDWAEARRQWLSCGLELPGTEGPIEGDFGIVCIRLNPWGDGETVYARRIDVVRAQLLNVPLPESGYRRDDIVLHDGASTGRRPFNGSTVLVFNALQRLQRSPYRTYIVMVSADQAAIAELIRTRSADIVEIEDWTASVHTICRRCSYGVPHQHADQARKEGEWEPERSLGVAARNRQAVEELLTQWVANGSGRIVDGLERTHTKLQRREFGNSWWLSEAAGSA